MASIEIQTDESLTANAFHPSVSWRSILAGVLISLFCFGILACLGMAVGSIRQAPDFVAAAQGGIQASIAWALVAAAISLFVASYFAARISNFRSRRIGMAQGVIVAAIFFGLTLTQSPVMISALGPASGALMLQSQLGRNMTTSNGSLNGLIEDRLADLNLGNRSVVARDLAGRLSRGDVNSAALYLSNQAHISVDDANQRVVAIDTATMNGRRAIQDRTSSLLRSTGWGLLATLLVGLLASISGGAWASGVNIRLPMSMQESQPRYRTAYAS